MRTIFTVLCYVITFERKIFTGKHKGIVFYVSRNIYVKHKCQGYVCFLPKKISSYSFS